MIQRVRDKDSKKALAGLPIAESMVLNKDKDRSSQQVNSLEKASTPILGDSLWLAEPFPVLNPATQPWASTSHSFFAPFRPNPIRYISRSNQPNGPPIRAAEDRRRHIRDC